MKWSIDLTKLDAHHLLTGSENETMDFKLPPAKLPFIDSWIFFGSPIPMLCIFALYFSIIAYGSAYMKNRKPFDLKNIIRCYNLYQIISCSAFCLLAHYGWGYNVFKATWKCLKYSDYIHSEDEMVYVYSLYWFFFLLRMSELVETVFFVLRKKQNQISFLHVYHHISTVVLLYVLNRYSANIMEAHVAILNNNVHILMYTYYFLSSFDSLVKPLSKIKPLMTTIQIVQLFVILGQCFAAVRCGSTNLFYVTSCMILVLIYSFGKFFYENYMKPRFLKKVV